VLTNDKRPISHLKFLVLYDKRRKTARGPVARRPGLETLGLAFDLNVDTPTSVEAMYIVSKEVPNPSGQVILVMEKFK
jgi:hypothetical protein